MLDDSPGLLGVGAIFLDDIILADGTEHRSTLGGGVTHALMAAPLFGERPDICAVVGKDIPREVTEKISKWINPRGLVELPFPQMRAWQIFDESGHRREIARVGNSAPFFEGAKPSHLHAELETAEAVYLLQDPQGMRGWAEALPDALKVWEPLQQVMLPERADEIRSILSDGLVHAVSPNLREARAVWGDSEPAELTAAILQDGAKLAVIRLGADGCIVQAAAQKPVLVPAVPVSVVDQTGAGNTFCGALTLGLMRGLSPTEAARMGAVAAASCLEQIGVLDPELVDPLVVRSRMAWLETQMAPSGESETISS